MIRQRSCSVILRCGDCGHEKLLAFSFRIALGDIAVEMARSFLPWSLVSCLKNAQERNEGSGLSALISSSKMSF
jgi:hypothetical protein